MTKHELLKTNPADRKTTIKHMLGLRNIGMKDRLLIWLVLEGDAKKTDSGMISYDLPVKMTSMHTFVEVGRQHWQSNIGELKSMGFDFNRSSKYLLVPGNFKNPWEYLIQ